MRLQPVNHSLGEAQAEGQHPAKSAPMAELAPPTSQKQTHCCWDGQPSRGTGGQPPLQNRQVFATMWLWDFLATFKFPFLPALSQDSP